MAATLAKGGMLDYEADPKRHQYLVATRGAVIVNGLTAQPRDGIAVTGEAAIRVEALDDCEVVMVDAR
jgi:hypothetical protein